jgi:hypothetical protein
VSFPDSLGNLGFLVLKAIAALNIKFALLDLRVLVLRAGRMQLAEELVLDDLAATAACLEELHIEWAFSATLPAII